MRKKTGTIMSVAATLVIMVSGCSSSSGAQSQGRTGPSTTAASPATTGVHGKSADGACRGSAPPATFDHVVWIIMENRGLDEVLSSGSAPYLASLAAGCGLATDYSGVAHPSLPNYVALTSGSTQGIADDAGPATHRIAARSIFQLLGAGWRTLAESMPANCDRSSSGEYAVKHNPAVYYTAISASCESQDVPLGATPDLSARFTVIVPNLCDDMHDCSTRAGDSWLSREVPAILASPEYRSATTALFITWDENDAGGSLVPAYVVAPSVVPGTRSGQAFDHYSLLRTTEELLGLRPLLGHAATARGMQAAFHL